MEQYYKSFMDRQHPSEDLIADTVSKVKTLSEEKDDPEVVENSEDRNFVKTRKGRTKWKYGIVISVMLCIVTGGIWQWSMRIVYPDLTTALSVEEKREYAERQKESFGEERNSYLGMDSPYFYVFDKNADRFEIKIGKGIVVVQTGTVEIAGNQLLYQIKPQCIEGEKTFLGKMEIDEAVYLLAAWDLDDLHYYLEGKDVTEEEMTSYVKELIRKSRTEKGK